MNLIWVWREAESFFKKDWTTQISLKCLVKFAFARIGFFGLEGWLRDEAVVWSGVDALRISTALTVLIRS